MPKLRHRTPQTGTDLVRCRMCGTTVVLGPEGCCPLGHPAGSSTRSPVAAAPPEAGPVEAEPAEAEPVEAEAAETEAVETEPAEGPPVEGPPVEGPPVEGPPAEATPTEARLAEGTSIDEVAPPTAPAESTTRADEDADTASRLDWLDWDATAGPAAVPSEPAGLPTLAKLPPPPAATARQLPPAADRVPESDDARTALDALLAAHHQRVPPSTVDVAMGQLRLPGPPATLASSPATDAHGHDDAHAEALILAALLLGDEADEETEERPRRSRRLAVRVAGAVMLLLLTAAMTAAVVVAV